MVKKGSKPVVKKVSKQKVVTKKSTAKKASATKKPAVKKKTVAKKVAEKTTTPKKAKVAKKTTKASKIKAVWEKKVGPDVSFYTLNEKKISSIIGLVKEMEEMQDEVYHHHVSFQHNDFANWIEGVFVLPELAEEIRTSHSKDEMQLVLLKYIINNG